MKNILGLSFALTVLAATSAYAAPSQTQVSAQAVAAFNVDQQAVQNFDTVSLDRQNSESKNPMLRPPAESELTVAENRAEFGSKYQRY